jgi:hypothetical protein
MIKGLLSVFIRSWEPGVLRELHVYILKSPTTCVLGHFCRYFTSEPHLHMAALTYTVKPDTPKLNENTVYLAVS